MEQFGGHGMGSGLQMEGLSFDGSLFVTEVKAGDRVGLIELMQGVEVLTLENLLFSELRNKDIRKLGKH